MAKCAVALNGATRIMISSEGYWKKETVVPTYLGRYDRYVLDNKAIEGSVASSLRGAIRSVEKKVVGFNFAKPKKTRFINI